jgi:hypothetical protein
VDWFTPQNWSAMDADDLDLASSGPLLIPNTSPSLLAGGGKTGVLYVLNTTSLGHYSATDAGVVQEQSISSSSLRGGPVYWQRSASNGGPLLFDWGTSDWVKAYAFNGTTFSATPISQASGTQIYPGGILALSANGQQAGTGVLWATVATSGNVYNDATDPGVLYAYNATDLTAPIWSSVMNSAHDNYGSFAKFVPPTVANGKVYVATFSGQVAVYGLLASGSAPVSVNLSAAADVLGIETVGTAVGDGGLDSQGYAYAANLIGTSISWSGATFTLGTAGTIDAVSNKTLSLPAGNYSTMQILATGVDGNQAAQTFVVTYTDGTTQSFIQSLSDWGHPQGYAGESTASTMAYRVAPAGTQNTGNWHLYGYSFALNNAETVQSITLPANRSVVILAIDLTP